MSGRTESDNYRPAFNQSQAPGITRRELFLLNRLPQVSPDRTDEWRIAFAMLRFAQRGFDRDYLCRQVIQSTESQIATNLIVTGLTHFDVFPVRHAFRALSDYFHNSYFELQIQFRMIESPHFRPFGGQGRSVIVCLVFRHRPAAVVLADIPVAANGHTLFPESRNDLARVYGLADSLPCAVVIRIPDRRAALIRLWVPLSSP